MIIFITNVSAYVFLLIKKHFDVGFHKHIFIKMKNSFYILILKNIYLWDEK